MFLVTRNPTPDLPPDAVGLVTQINFTVTRSGLGEDRKEKEKEEKISYVLILIACLTLLWLTRPYIYIHL